MSIVANLYPNGLGSALGTDYTIAEPLYFSGNVYYVDSATGSDTLTGLVESCAGDDRPDCPILETLSARDDAHA